MMATNLLADRFEADRERLRGLAYRMLGSLAEAEDAVQEAWLRLARAGADGIENLGGWLTTVTGRVCLDMLRARSARREDSAGTRVSEAESQADERVDPEQEAMLADSVGLALLVVLDRLPPAERVAFVLHDLFDLTFEEIAPVVGRSVEASRQLASRGRRRVRGGTVADPDRVRRAELVAAFLEASRSGDLQGLLALLDPGVVFRADVVAQRMGSRAEIRGADAVAATFKGRAQAARPAFIDGVPGLLVILNGRLRIVLRLTLVGERIAAIDAIADPARLADLKLGVADR